MDYKFRATKLSLRSFGSNPGLLLQELSTSSNNSSTGRKSKAETPVNKADCSVRHSKTLHY
jgi:hypothetical protein